MQSYFYYELNTSAVKWYPFNREISNNYYKANISVVIIMVPIQVRNKNKAANEDKITHIYHNEIEGNTVLDNNKLRNKSTMVYILAVIPNGHLPKKTT